MSAESVQQAPGAAAPRAYLCFTSPGWRFAQRLAEALQPLGVSAVVPDPPRGAPTSEEAQQGRRRVLAEAECSHLVLIVTPDVPNALLSSGSWPYKEVSSVEHV